MFNAVLKSQDHVIPNIIGQEKMQIPDLAWGGKGFLALARECCGEMIMVLSRVLVSGNSGSKMMLNLL